MLKTNIRKYDNFKLYYWHGATLVGKYRLPQLAPTQAIPSKVICFNERKGIIKPEEYWVDFFIDDALFENFWNHPEISFENLKRFAGIITTDYSMLPEMLPTQNYGTVPVIELWRIISNRMDLISFLLPLGVLRVILNGALMVYRKIVLLQLQPMVVCQVHMASVYCCVVSKSCKNKNHRQTLLYVASMLMNWIFMIMSIIIRPFPKDGRSVLCNG